jgi:hypothetical protein
MKIEEIILKHDTRGISNFSEAIAANSCASAATLILNNFGKVFITTGFYILSAKSAETDGPPGAIALGNALEKLGYEVIFITDMYCSSLLNAVRSKESKVIEFPIADQKTSKEYSAKLLTEENPNILISIERCGSSSDYKYRNMRNEDISDFTAKIDYMFNMHSQTIGIGDGGNEIGMGNITNQIIKSKTLVEFPTISEVRNLIIASVSNWGAYGLLAALSIQCNRILLPTKEDQEDLIIKLAQMGAVDGFSGSSEYKVDGKELEINSQILQELHNLVTKTINH